MKKQLSLLLVGLLLLSGLSVFADTKVEAVPIMISEPQPELYEDKEGVPFEVKQDGNEFTIILDANPSTGYAWVYAIADEAHVTFKNEEIIPAEVEMPGAPVKMAFTFEVKSKGISTIEFSYQRPWEGIAEKTLRILAYKTEDKLIVEEDQIVSIMDGAIEVNENVEMYYNDVLVESELKAKDINGKTMIPLSTVLNAMEYEVKWVPETRSIEIMKGAQWTSITIDKNMYFRNKMAPWTLSSAPVIVEGRTYVPVEFMVDILGKGLQVEDRNLKFNDNDFAIHQGFVKEITHDETGTMTITIEKVKGSEDMMDWTVIHTSKAYTHYQKEVIVGDSIKVVSSMMMTMSIPGQTSGYVVY